MMKRISILFLALCLLLSLAACGGKTEEAPAAPTWQEQYDLGIKYLSEGNYEEAIIAFTAAIEIDPKQADAYIGLADVYVASGDPESARQVMEEAISVLGDAADNRLTDYLASLTPQESPDTSLEIPKETVTSEAGNVSGTLELSNVSYTFNPNSHIVEYNEGAVGGLELSFTVNGPASVKAVWISSWQSVEYGGYTPEMIQEDISNTVEIWRADTPTLKGGQIPPFDDPGSCRPVYPDELGQTQQILLIGLDENMNAAGYALITTAIPG